MDKVRAEQKIQKAMLKSDFQGEMPKNAESRGKKFLKMINKG
jgi:hypothetical protein